MDSPTTRLTDLALPTKSNNVSHERPLTPDSPTSQSRINTMRNTMAELTPPPTPKTKMDTPDVETIDVLEWTAGLLILYPLGEGSWSKVYAARTLVEDRPLVAVKVAKFESATLVLEKEADVLTHLMRTGHARDKIVEFYGYDFTTDSITLEKSNKNLTEWVEDRIYSMLQSTSPHPPDDPIIGSQSWCEMTGCLVVALDWLRDQNVVHADIKPDNVLVTCRDTFVLADFSSSFVLPAPEKSAVDAITRNYASPETLKSYCGNDPGPRCETFSSDLWSLAAVLLYAATGVEPFSHIDNSQTQIAMAADGRILQAYSVLPLAKAVRIQKGSIANTIASPCLKVDLSLRADSRRLRIHAKEVFEARGITLAKAFL